MSILSKIITPAMTPEQIESELNSGKPVEIKDDGKIISSGDDAGIKQSEGEIVSTDKSPLEFKPINESILPPLQDVKPEITDSPPISEDGDIAAGGVPVSELPDEPVSSPDLQPGTNEHGIGDFAEQKRGRGRPPGSKSSPRPPEILTSGADPEKQLLAVAGMTFDMSTGALALILGEEWNPKSKQEREFVVTAIANYYRATGTVDLPPGWTLAFVISAYSLPRMTEPKTKEKLAATWYWIKTKIAGFFPRRKK